MPEVWEQEGHLRARPCFRGDIEEELKRVDVDSQHTKAARTPARSATTAEATAATAATARKIADHGQTADASTLGKGFCESGRRYP